MSTSLESLLVVRDTPGKCDAGSCRKRAVVRLGLSHARWRAPQSTVLCGDHEPVFVKAAQAKGVVVTVEKRWKP